MTNKQTGGPAFPSTHHNCWGEPEKGMTLRDYFAAKVLHGMLADQNMPLDDDKLAEWSYRVADAMLKAREQ